MGFADRGVIREGMRADITVFDFDRIQDNATWERPTAAPAGIDYVVVNGEVTLDQSGYTGAKAGVGVVVQLTHHGGTEYTEVARTHSGTAKLFGEKHTAEYMLIELLGVLLTTNSPTRCLWRVPCHLRVFRVSVVSREVCTRAARARASPPEPPRRRRCFPPPR